MSNPSLRDIIPLILKLHVQSGEQLNNDEESLQYICRYLEHLELFDPNFDKLGIVEAGKNLLLKHMDIGNGSIVDKEVVIGDFVKRKGLESVRAAVLSILNELNESVELKDLQYSDNKKRKRNDLFQPFNFDDYPPYEPVDMHIENLREDRDVKASLTFLLTVDINDFRGHYLWPDLLQSLKKALSQSVDLDTTVLILTIYYRFLQGFCEERQSTDLVNCILEYLTTQWLGAASVSVAGSILKLQFALFELCLKIPLQIMMEININESSAILASVLRLLANGMVSMSSTVTVPVRLALVHNGSLRFCSLFFGFLRKFKVNLVAQALDNSALSTVLAQDLSASSDNDALFKYFARHVIHSVRISSKSSDNTSSCFTTPLSFITPTNRSQVTDTLYSYINNEFMSIAKRSGNVSGAIVSLWSVVKDCLDLEEWDSCPDLLSYFLGCFDHLSSIESSPVVLALLGDAVLVTQEVLRLTETSDSTYASPELMKSCVLELAKLWSKLVTSWTSDCCNSPEVLNMLHGILLQIKALKVTSEVNALYFLVACSALSVDWKSMILEELLSYSIVFFSSVAANDGDDDHEAVVDTIDAVIPSIVRLIHESGGKLPQTCSNQLGELVSRAIARLSQDEEYLELSDLQLRGLLEGLVFVGQHELLVRLYCIAKPTLNTFLTVSSVSAHLLAGVCLGREEFTEHVEGFILNLLIQATSDVHFRVDCVQAMFRLLGDNSMTIREVSVLLTAFLKQRSELVQTGVDPTVIRSDRLNNLLLPVRPDSSEHSPTVTDGTIDDIIHQLVEGVLSCYTNDVSPSESASAVTVNRVLGQLPRNEKLSLESVYRAYFIGVCSPPSKIYSESLEQLITEQALAKSVEDVCRCLKQTYQGHYWNLYHQVSVVPMRVLVQDMLKKWFVGYLPLVDCRSICRSVLNGFTVPCLVATAVVIHLAESYALTVLKGGDRDYDCMKLTGIVREIVLLE